MYFPYMRGKHFELAALKELAPRLSSEKVCPIIEPINDNINKLSKAIEPLNNINIIPHIILNPEVGDLANDNADYLYCKLQQENISFIPCIRLYSQNLSYVEVFLNQLIEDKIKFSLYIQEEMQDNISTYTTNAIANIILDHTKYPNLFINSLPRSVVINSSFPSKDRNADYKTSPQFFSDAHLSYSKPLIQGQIGFGDYLTIRNKWSTSGGPAYVVAVHITYINNDNSNMYVKHSLSKSSPDNQSDPGGKFKEALDEMIQFSKQNPSIDQNTLGFQEYLTIHNNKSFHGLGVPKKLSMMHHIETMNNYL